jgi:hypothetical protein
VAGGDLRVGTTLLCHHETTINHPSSDDGKMSGDELAKRKSVLWK